MEGKTNSLKSLVRNWDCWTFGYHWRRV